MLAFGQHAMCRSDFFSRFFFCPGGGGDAEDVKKIYFMTIYIVHICLNIQTFGSFTTSRKFSMTTAETIYKCKFSFQ